MKEIFTMLLPCGILLFLADIALSDLKSSNLYIWLALKLISSIVIFIIIVYINMFLKNRKAKNR